MYRVKSDKSFFEKFSDMSNKLKNLSYPFQNPNTIMEDEDVFRWDREMDEFKNELRVFVREAENRFYKRVILMDNDKVNMDENVKKLLEFYIEKTKDQKIDYYVEPVTKNGKKYLKKYIRCDFI